MPENAGPSDSLLRLRLRTGPRVSDRSVADRRLSDLEAVGDDALRQLLDTPRLRNFLAGIADHSPFLWGLIESDPPRLQRFLTNDPGRSLDGIHRFISAAVADEPETEIMRRLRRGRQDLALLLALADLGGVWDLEMVVQTLSKAADLMIGAALDWLLRRAHIEGKLKLPKIDSPQFGCGLCILGLGKLGGRELNYSSDVDLIAIFDPESPAVVRKDRVATVYVRIVQDLVKLLQLTTADGHVLRVDLRLRPDPGSTAVAMSINAAFNYYEALGQNWERAAMIKARPVAGDFVLGNTFLDDLVPFVWRRYFDFAAIADIHAMKRQIHAVKGHGEIAVAGHNVKLGRGGIREIEFFVQTQQLIFGGKRPALRGSRTLEMLRQLRRDGWISNHAVADLSRAYVFLRRTEHRLQMLRDDQTHRLPQAPADLERFARFSGFASAERFAHVLLEHLRCVVHHYASLFEHEPQLDDARGSLVFTGTSEDPDTLETLTKLGYRAPDAVWRTVRDWHAGKRLGVRSPRSRETLTALVPKLLVAFAATFEPDAALAAMDKALERMPAAGELFAILDKNPSTLALFAEFLGSAPLLAETIASSPHLLDAIIGPQDAAELDPVALERTLSASLARASSTEALLDAIRDLQHEEHFLIGAKLLSGSLPVDDAGAAYSALAEATIRILLLHLAQTFREEHGVVAGGAAAIVAMGKLGSREMTAASDLDLVLIYDFDPDAPQSDGLRPLHAAQYYGRLTQRLLSYLTVATRRGRLYEVDMRLRPSGRQGPLASKLSAFASYQRSEAATWEHMALTRARVIAGEPDFCDRVAADIVEILSRPAHEDLARDVVAMRALIEREKPPKSPWDFKLVRGGLIDIEFIAQYLVLLKASGLPELLDPSTKEILQRAGRLGVLTPDDAAALTNAHALYSNVTQIFRLALSEAHDPDRAGPGVKKRLADVAGVPDFTRLEVEIARLSQAVRDLFEAILSGRRVVGGRGGAGGTSSELDAS